MMVLSWHSTTLEVHRTQKYAYFDPPTTHGGDKSIMHGTRGVLKRILQNSVITLFKCVCDRLQRPRHYFGNMPVTPIYCRSQLGSTPL